MLSSRGFLKKNIINQEMGNFRVPYFRSPGVPGVPVPGVDQPPLVAAVPYQVVIGMPTHMRILLLLLLLDQLAAANLG